MRKSTKLLMTLLILSLTSITSAQNILPNEVNIFSFQTQSGKTVTLAKDKNENYIIYRFGTKEKIELEFPKKVKESWKKFTYSYYLRGGGIQNEGMDLDFIAFTNQGFKYVIYNTYYAVENETEVGIKIINLKTKKITKIPGKINTRKGNLADFRFNKLLKIDDELYE